MKKFAYMITTISLISCFVWLSSICFDRKKLNQDMIRLRVIAQSDSKQDQEMKLIVKDQIISFLDDDMGHIKNTADAVSYLQSNLSAIEQAANETLFLHDSSQKAILTFTEEGFENAASVGGFSDSLTDTFQLKGGYEILFFILDLFGCIEKFFHDWQ